jgi:hypothetical protein
MGVVNVLSAKEIHACRVLLVTVGVTVALCSGCGSDDMASTGGEPARTATVACDVGRAGPPSIESAFVDHLPREYAVEEICATDVGPGLARAEVRSRSSTSSTAAVTGPPGQRKRMFNVARPKIFRPPDFAATMTTPVRVAGSSDLIRPLYSMSAPSVADTIAGWDSRTA